MNPNLLFGPGCALAGMLIALYIKDRSREIAKIEFAEQIKSVLAIFKMDLLESLDKKYARSDSLDSRDDRLDIFDTRFEVLEARVTSLEKHGKQ